jgi:hypothetical protein
MSSIAVGTARCYTCWCEEWAAGQVGGTAMNEALGTILSIVGTVAVVILAPLAFMLIFSLVSGFNERMSENE